VLSLNLKNWSLNEEKNFYLLLYLGVKADVGLQVPSSVGSDSPTGVFFDSLSRWQICCSDTTLYPINPIICHANNAPYSFSYHPEIDK
jgi:hypothetical protein